MQVTPDQPDRQDLPLHGRLHRLPSESTPVLSVVSGEGRRANKLAGKRPLAGARVSRQNRPVVVQSKGGVMVEHRCPGPLFRRDFLRVGTLALGGLSLSDLLATRASAPPTSVIPPGPGPDNERPAAGREQARRDGRRGDPGPRG